MKVAIMALGGDGIESIGVLCQWLFGAAGLMEALLYWSFNVDMLLDRQDCDVSVRSRAVGTHLHTVKCRCKPLLILSIACAPDTCASQDLVASALRTFGRSYDCPARGHGLSVVSHGDRNSCGSTGCDGM